MMDSKQKFIDAWSRFKEQEYAVDGLPIGPASACVAPRDLENTPNLQKLGRL